MKVVREIIPDIIGRPGLKKGGKLHRDSIPMEENKQGITKLT